MPDDSKEPCNCTWTVNNVVTCISAIFAGFAALIGTWNATKIHTVSNKQEVQVQKADEVKKELDDRQVIQDKQLQVIEDSVGPTLLASWKYIQEFADSPGATQKDKDAASKAKKAYEDYVARQKAKVS